MWGSILLYKTNRIIRIWAFFSVTDWRNPWLQGLMKYERPVLERLEEPGRRRAAA
jgi:hypothetical protein